MTLPDTPAEIFGYTFSRPELLDQALTHKSFANENKALGVKDNERLEFLGDAVLDLALSDLLMRRFPEEAEGSLSKRRAALVNEDFLSKISGDSGLVARLRLGKGEVATGGSLKPRIQASALEAVIGAIFLDRGFDAAWNVLQRIFDPHLSLPLADGGIERDFKSRLQEKCQKSLGQVPVYKVVSESGPEHAREYLVHVWVQDRELGQGQGRTKKAAEQRAAQVALEKLSTEVSE